MRKSGPESKVLEQTSRLLSLVTLWGDMEVLPETPEIISHLRADTRLAELVVNHLIDIEALFELEACLEELVSRLMNEPFAN